MALSQAQRQRDRQAKGQRKRDGDTERAHDIEVFITTGIMFWFVDMIQFRLSDILIILLEEPGRAGAARLRTR